MLRSLSWLAIHQVDLVTAARLLKEARPLAEDDMLVRKLIDKAEQATVKE